ncbi:hypothetical protein [Clostridium beijerinckii]|uniref:hypothetical protein n=1 Tax=Clostridium beijerinckii TaxID=1520 RepID=UPI00232F6BED|nr:hypothetical protein [Clostridium beijerinckii]
MESMKRLMLGVVGVLSLVATTSVPVFAVDASALKDSTALNNKTSYQDYADKLYTNTDTTQATSSSATQTIDTRMQQASALRSGWNVIMNDPSQIYYVKDGAKVSGWVKTPTWHYFDQSKGNAMLTNSWLNDSGKWYYLDCRGEMYYSTYVAGLGSFDASGAWLGYDKVDSYTAISGMTVVDKSKTDTGSTIISRDDFSSKVLNGSIKARIQYGSTGGGAEVGALHWYLA